MATTEQQQIPLYLKAWLTPKCHVELILSGEPDPEAFRKLASFLSLTAEMWESAKGVDVAEGVTDDPET